MSKNKDNLITFTDENGKEVLCEILFTYHSDEFNKDYVVFYEKGADESDGERIEVNAAIYVNSTENSGSLLPIETDEEWDLIEYLLEEFANDEQIADEEEFEDEET